MLLLVQRPDDVSEVQRALTALGVWSHVAHGQEATALVVEPFAAAVDAQALRSLPGVREVLLEASAHPRVDAQAGAVVRVGSVVIGGGRPLLVAGPCAVESAEQIASAAAMAREAGAGILRGGAFKPRTSPYSFAGHGREALLWLRRAADRHGLAVATEVMSEGEVSAVAEVADLIQIGSRSMQSFALLKAAGRAGKPVLLKRGMAARIEEWLLAAEHLLVAGAPAVIFCERGIVGFDSSTRNLLDLAAVALLKHVYRQPVVVDPSHAVGRRDLILPLAHAAVAAGADGIVVEAHPHAAAAHSDGPQALNAAELCALGRALALTPRASA